jgi:hypothetical protein
MLVLKADPWRPDYGMGYDVATDDEPATVDASAARQRGWPTTDASAFHLDSGRLCVLASRHRQACVFVGRAGAA